MTSRSKKYFLARFERISMMRNDQLQSAAAASELTCSLLAMNTCILCQLQRCMAAVAIYSWQERILGWNALTIELQLPKRFSFHNHKRVWSEYSLSYVFPSSSSCVYFLTRATNNSRAVRFVLFHLCHPALNELRNVAFMLFSDVISSWNRTSGQGIKTEQGWLKEAGLHHNRYLILFRKCQLHRHNMVNHGC